jgi:hypothetical protein
MALRTTRVATSGQVVPVLYGKLGGASIILAAALIVGCGPRVDRPRVEFVEGLLTLDGQPLGGATVGLVPSDDTGLAAYGRTNEAGNFRLTSSRGGLPGAGAVAGTYRVTVQKIVDESEVEQPSGGEPSIEDYERWLREQGTRRPRVSRSAVPTMYAAPETSGLTATIGRGKNRLTFDLDSVAGR